MIVRVNHIARIGNMTSKVNVIGLENIGADDFIFFFSNECIHSRTKPMLIQILPRSIRRENIGVTRGYHLLKNGPNRIGLLFLICESDDQKNYLFSRIPALDDKYILHHKNEI